LLSAEHNVVPSGRLAHLSTSEGAYAASGADTAAQL
jgi:hypothetical protein